jgi:hypothetical protein
LSKVRNIEPTKNQIRDMDKTESAMKQIEERTKVAVSDDKLRTELQLKRHVAGAKKIDNRHHMNIRNKIHNTANNSEEIITEDFVGYQLRQHRRGQR